MHPLSISRRPRLTALMPAFVIVVAACASRSGDAALRESWDPRSVSEVKGVPAAELRAALVTRLRGSPSEGLNATQWRRLRTTYEAYDYAPLILEQRGVGKRAEGLVMAITTAHADAIDTDRYDPDALQQALRTVRNGRLGAEELAQADVTLAAAYFQFADDLLTGQMDPRQVNPDWRIDPRGMNVDSILVRTLRMEPLGQAIAQLRPRSDEYRALQEQLARYRTLVAEGGWVQVPESGTLNPRDTSTVVRLTALRDRMAAEGYVSGAHALALVDGDTLRAVYDETLAGAVAEFQRRHAIDVDSILGPGTAASLNLPADYRLGQIASNLERLRWLPRDLGDRYIYVNVPAFRLDAYDNGAPVLSMRVIVGSEYRDRSTPAFADSMSYLEFAPYWNVPENIANEEIWPKASADPGYLERSNYEVVNDGGTTRIRQRPGRHNALGLVKFMFPNEFAIYLHHTPQEELFERDIRAFSHGCIRVEKPAELAEYALAGQDDWSLPRIREAMEGDNRRVDLDRKIPVYIVYLTTFVNDGVLYFGNDVYDRDAPLVGAMAGAAMPPGESVALLAALRREAGGSLVDRLRTRLGI